MYIFIVAEQASRHEAREFKQFKDQSYTSGIQVAYDAALANPEDGYARASAMTQFDALTRAHMLGADETTINQEILNLQSKLDSALITKIAQDDPKKAFDILNDKESGLILTPETKDKLIAAIKPKAEFYEIQRITDGLVNKYGFENGQDVLNYIRKAYSGKREHDIVVAYKERLNEYRYAKIRKEIAENRAQEDFYDTLLEDFYKTGVWPEREVLRQYVDDKKLSPRRAMQIENSRKATVTRTQIKNKLSKQAGWTDLSREEQQEYIMNETAKITGVTQEDREDALAYFDGKAVTNQINPTELQMALDKGLITEDERNEYKNYNKNFKAEQIAFRYKQAKELKDEVGRIEWKGENSEAYQDRALELFKKELEFVNPATSDYQNKVLQARQNALVKLIEITTKLDNNKEVLEQSAFEWLSPSTWLTTKPTKIGSIYDTAKKNLEELKRNPTQYNRPIKHDDNVTINAANRADGSPLWHSVIDARNITSRKGLRNGKKHNGIDIGAAGGSAVRVPPISGLKVKKTVTGSFKGDTKHPEGNAVFLDGKLPNGDKIELRMFHLKEDSITVKSGDIVDAGSVIAEVGNTGRVRGKNGGYHLHLEVLVNNEYQDPEKFLLPKVAKKKSIQKKQDEQAKTEEANFLTNEIA